MKRWRHPQSLQQRVYINHPDLDEADIKVYVMPQGKIALVRYAGNGDWDDLPSWYAEEAMAKGVSVEVYIFHMALEDAGMSIKTALFEEVWAEAD